MKKRVSVLFTLCSALAAVTLTGCDLTNLSDSLIEKIEQITGLDIDGKNPNEQNNNNNQNNNENENQNSNDQEHNEQQHNNEEVDAKIAAYYANINENDSNLLNSLHNLNASKKKKNVGYKTMLNSPSMGFYVTDPGTSVSSITTFYSGKSNKGTSGLNREHVWPNSHGGNLVEDDIHMVRPTLNAENGSRGNSFYVEGKCDGEKGWDPAKEDFGLESYRGDSARIIFYCAIAELRLTLVDIEYHECSNNNKDYMMGKLSDLLKWNLKYPVLDREKTRNDGAEKLQGNRNPFIDHPEYACKIWGKTNATTRQICGIK